jgi:hypothetical protein
MSATLQALIMAESEERRQAAAFREKADLSEALADRQRRSARSLLLQGETTGDPIRDFVYYVRNERREEITARLAELSVQLQPHRGQLILVTSRRWAEISFHLSEVHVAAPNRPPDIQLQTSYLLGIIDGGDMETNLAESVLTIPAKGCLRRAEDGRILLSPAPIRFDEKVLSHMNLGLLDLPAKHPGDAWLAAAATPLWGALALSIDIGDELVETLLIKALGPRRAAEFLMRIDRD